MTNRDDAPTDLILRGGRVFTANPAQPWADAVAIRGGRIAAVGPEEEIGTFAGAKSQVFDLPGRLVLPGFQDSHCHPPAGGLERSQCNLNDIHDRQEYLRVIERYAGANPDVPWIRGGGWYMPVFPGGTPRREDLDAVVPERPALLTNRDGHGAWANSRALQMAGVTADTPDPGDGRIERDPDGSPSGTLHEGAMDLVERVMPKTTREELAKGLMVAQEYLHSFGITSWQDAIVGSDMWGDTLDVYLDAARSGALTARVVGALWWERTQGEEQVEGLLESRARGSAGRFKATSVKIMQDGVLENGTGGMLEPYLDPCGVEGCGHDRTNRGMSFVDPEALKGYVTRLDREGFQVHFHAIGDRAVRECLDAVEAAVTANGPNDNRHHIAHIQVIHPDDLPRFARLGVVANCQPLWAELDAQMVDLTIPFLGPERSAWQYPFASLHRSGARLAFGSDWSVSSPNPLEEIDIAVNRSGPPDTPGATPDSMETWLPEECLDLATAIEAFTIGSAFVNHLDDVTGSIEVGKYADMAVVDRDLFDPGVGRISDARVILTLAEGETVFLGPEVSGS